jgi:hypothetical protein
MVKYYMVAVFVLGWLLVNHWFGKRIFEKNVYKIYIGLHWQLIFSRRREEGSYVRAQRYLRLKNLNQGQLDSLLLLVHSKITNVNITTQIFGALFTLMLTLVTLLFGGVFSAILGGLFSRFTEEVFGSGDNKIIESIIQSGNKIIDSSAPDFICLLIIFCLGVSIWGKIQMRLNETKFIIGRIIEEEQKRKLMRVS